MVNKEEREKFAGGKGILSYEVSAKTGDEVDRLFVELSKQLMEIHPKADQVMQGNAVMKNTRDKINRLKIQTGGEELKKNSSCC